VIGASISAAVAEGESLKTSYDQNSSIGRFSHGFSHVSIHTRTTEVGDDKENREVVFPLSKSFLVVVGERFSHQQSGREATREFE